MTRSPQNILKVPPRPMSKFRIRDKISGGGSGRLAGICIFEIQQVFSCLRNSSFNERACAKEVGNFLACYERHYENHFKTGGAETTGKASIEEINTLLKRFPERKKEK